MSNHEARQHALLICNETLLNAAPAYDVETSRQLTNDDGERLYAFPCKADPELFFGEGHSAATLAATMICNRCFVKSSCQAEGFKPINMKSGAGIYGGLTLQQRADIRRNGNVA